MAQDERLEARLKEFYDLVPDVEDALPFKEHLLKNEDSRMAWYLLGKQYESKGQQAKANYCFRQAGEVYEAFESKPVPAEADSYVPERKGGGAPSWRWLAVAAAAVLLISGYLLYQGLRVKPPEPAVAKPGIQTYQTPLPAAGGIAADRPDGARSGNGKIRYGVIAGAAEAEQDGAIELTRLLSRTEPGAAMLVRAPKLGAWTDWLNGDKPVASVAAGKDPGAKQLQWHDAGWCGCGADDGAVARQAAAAWQPLQEAKLVLRSAVLQYRQRTGVWPDGPAQLAASYPNNTMAGWLADMTPWIEEWKAVLDNKRDGKIPQTVGWPGTASDRADDAGAALPAGAFAPMTEAPIEIVVDKKNRRLAVVSGNVLLRNYAVGLGGDRTPEGTFAITEKVRDPNGRTDGVFGSRGMTLSNSRYGIHGTDKPDSIGKDESLGCVRMAKADLEELYDLVSIGTKVTIMKEGLPADVRVPPKRFRLAAQQDETNPGKVYDWLD